MNCGGAAIPPVASVATALVFSSGVTSLEPSAIDSSGVSSLPIPIFLATAMMASGLRLYASWSDTVLIDRDSA